MNITAQTLVLIDNSLSVSKANREITKLTLKYLFTHTNEGRSYCFSTFSHEMDYVESYTSDYPALEDMAERLGYENKETSLTDVLSSVLDEWEKSDFACRDILIFTDGAEEKALNYEKEELYYLLEHCSYPVYVVCLDQKENAGKVKNLSAIARLSGGSLFHTEFEDSEAEVERKLSEQILKSMDTYAQSHYAIYEGNSSENEMDKESINGDESYDEISEQDSEFRIEDTGLIENSYGLYRGINNITDVTKVENTGEFAFSCNDMQEDVVYEMSKENGFGSPLSYAIIGGSLFLVICLAALSVCLVIRHKKNLEREDEEYRRIIQEKLREDRGEDSYRDKYENYGERSRGISAKSAISRGNQAVMHEKSRIGETVAIVNRDDSDDDCSTRLLYSEAGCIEMTFEDANDPSKYYRVTPKGRVILGRMKSKCDIAFEYDDSVSSKHCELYSRDGLWYVKDLDSSNGTMVNGERVYTENIISSGDMLQMGSLMLIVRLT